MKVAPPSEDGRRHKGGVCLVNALVLNSLMIHIISPDDTYVCQMQVRAHVPTGPHALWESTALDLGRGQCRKSPAESGKTEGQISYSADIHNN